MDQLKEILRQAIKYRFWIATGIAALLPVIAYFAGTGAMKTEATAKAADIKGADEGVKKYSSGTLPNHQYPPLVKGKTAALTTDVNSAWRKLYERQAPLLTWPADVEDKFHEWGRKWPEGVDLAGVQLVINTYIRDYPEFVETVYKVPRPWDPQEGTGVVVTPPKEALLKPSVFDENKPPTDLGKIWSAQEKLWVQRALLEVVDKVNKTAKDWDHAVIKQINLLEVANPASLDQVSIAQGVTLQPGPTLTAPGSAAPATTAAAAPSGGTSSSASGEASQADMASAMAAQYGSGGMGSGMGPETDTVSYLSSSNDQYQVVPVTMSVFIDQNDINDFLVELANSPMSIQVVDYEQSRPSQRITKPVKGQTPAFGGYGMDSGAYGQGSMMFNMGGMGGPGGGYGREMADYGSMMAPGMNSAYGGMGGRAAAQPKAKGKDIRDRTKEKIAEERKKSRQVTEVKIHDPYYQIVEVRIYGQARFYNVPPAAPAEAPSAGDATAAANAAPDAAANANANAPAAPATGADAAAPAADAAKAETKDDAAAKDAAAKDAASKDEAKKDDAAAKDEAKKDDAAAKDDTKKDDAAAKDEAKPKDDTAKPAEEPKPDDSKPAEAAPKADASTPKK